MLTLSLLSILLLAVGALALPSDMTPSELKFRDDRDEQCTRYDRRSPLHSAGIGRRAH